MRPPSPEPSPLESLPVTLARAFPALAALERAAWQRMETTARRVTVPEGTRLFGVGDACTHYHLLLAGRVRVGQVAESGREIVLYRLVPGQTCILTTAALLAGDSHAAEAVAETPLRAVTLPATTVTALVAESAVFRAFMFATYAQRLSDLMQLVNEVAFTPVPRRLAACLLVRADDQGEVAGTHRDLAADLGTAREVVTRQLRVFARQGLVARQRGRIMLRDRAALARIATIHSESNG